MANDRIKVVGYATKDVFNGDIEYRNFSDDLVGNQATNGDSVFTFGNFIITSSPDTKPSKIFTTNKYSNFVNLCDLDLTEEESLALLNNNSEVKLNLDNTNLCNFAYFGSMLEYVRVSLEDIIIKWPASLYMTPISGIYANKLTVEDFAHDPIKDESTFKIDTNIIANPYQINFLTNGSNSGTFNETNELRNFTLNFLSYSVLNNEIEYPLLELTAATTMVDDYIHLKVKGNPFEDITGVTATTFYHIKPNKLKEDTFFNSLPDFEANLLNRFTVPKYSSTYKFPYRSEEGLIKNKINTYTWPVSDGYNIDFTTSEYTTYVTDLINMSTSFDENKTNLMVRFLTAEAISDFDTVPRCDGDEDETAGQKMNSTLKIYGRSYDEVKRYIDGIQYANTVSYNHLDNTPDAVLKYLARTMGWDLVSSVLENDLLKNYVTTPESSYSGMSRGYTAIEAEVEMWRRIILNTPWLWKSKGARKGIEFLFKFIGAPDGLIEFNEFIYLASHVIDVDQFKELLVANGLEPDISQYNIDSDGYPRVLDNNPNMYFQKGGLWYRQTAGTGATIDILTGNNPHVGPYDGGAAFIHQFNELIPNFTATTLTSTTETTTTSNLFTNYEIGKIDNYDGEYFVDVVSEADVELEDCVLVNTYKIPDPFPSSANTTDCGCDLEEDDYALKLDITCNFQQSINTEIVDCNQNVILLNNKGFNGWLEFVYVAYDETGASSGSYNSIYASQTCCRAFGGIPIYYEDWDTEVSPNRLINCGYVCCNGGNCGCNVTCDWRLSTYTYSDMPLINNERYLSFLKPNGETTVVTPTGCSCIETYTEQVVVTDPNSGEVGVGCKVTNGGINDLTNNPVTYYIDNNQILPWTPITDVNGDITNIPENGVTNSIIEATYEGRADGDLPCTQGMDISYN